jgi:hypothetical protein
MDQNEHYGRYAVVYTDVCIDIYTDVFPLICFEATDAFQLYFKKRPHQRYTI